MAADKPNEPASLAAEIERDANKLLLQIPPVWIGFPEDIDIGDGLPLDFLIERELVALKEMYCYRIRGTEETLEVEVIYTGPDGFKRAQRRVLNDVRHDYGKDAIIELLSHYVIEWRLTEKGRAAEKWVRENVKATKQPAKSTDEQSQDPPESRVAAAERQANELLHIIPQEWGEVPVLDEGQKEGLDLLTGRELVQLKTEYWRKHGLQDCLIDTMIEDVEDDFYKAHPHSRYSAGGVSSALNDFYKNHPEAFDEIRFWRLTQKGVKAKRRLRKNVKARSEEKPVNQKSIQQPKTEGKAAVAARVRHEYFAEVCDKVGIHPPAAEMSIEGRKLMRDQFQKDKETFFNCERKTNGGNAEDILSAYHYWYGYPKLAFLTGFPGEEGWDSFTKSNAEAEWRDVDDTYAALLEVYYMAMEILKFEAEKENLNSYAIQKCAELEQNIIQVDPMNYFAAENYTQLEQQYWRSCLDLELTWPKCLGKDRLKLAPEEQNIIRLAEESLARLRIRLEGRQRREGAGKPGEEKPPAKPTGKPLKQPIEIEVQAYRLAMFKGEKQKMIATMLSKKHRRPVSQPDVSRWVKKVKKWIEAGNVLPDPPGKHKGKTYTADPKKMEQHTPDRTHD